MTDPGAPPLNLKERMATFEEALASGDWAKIAAWQESERQLILAFVARERAG